MEGFLDKLFAAQTAAKIDLTQVEKRVTVAEVAQVDEIAFVSRKDGIAVLKVAMEGGVGVGNIDNESSNLVLF